MTTNVDDRQPALPALVAAIAAAPNAVQRLAALQRLAAALGPLQRAAVAEARAGGESWQTIGQSLGVSKQAAVKRFGQPAPEGPAPEGPAAAPAPAATPAPTTQKKAGTAWVVATPGGRILLQIFKRTQASKQR